MLLLATTALHAQAACPPGTIPYGTGNDPSACGPDNSQPQQQPEASRSPTLVWADYWGAISTDTPKGILGSSTHASSQTKAEKAAVADCRSKGGTQCILQVSFRNGCGAMIVGNKGYSVNSAPTLGEAVQKGMDICTKAGGDCHVYYSTCSLPGPVQ